MCVCVSVSVSVSVSVCRQCQCVCVCACVRVFVADLGACMRRAAVEGDKDSASVLVERGADINSADAKGNTALHEAAIRGHTALVRCPAYVDTCAALRMHSAHM